jgi:hypothetical protein
MSTRRRSIERTARLVPVVLPQVVALRLKGVRCGRGSNSILMRRDPACQDRIPIVYFANGSLSWLLVRHRRDNAAG